MDYVPSKINLATILQFIFFSVSIGTGVDKRGLVRIRSCCDPVALNCHKSCDASYAMIDELSFKDLCQLRALEMRNVKTSPNDEDN